MLMEFKEWLTKEMQSRGWNINDLARAAGVSRGALGNIVRGERSAGPDVCTGIANAFKLPPEQVFRRAGLLPQATPLHETIEQISHIMNLLATDEQNNLLEYARFRLQVQDEKPKYRTARDTPPTPRK
jgi:transcriptional regulator with XRE-family HTH domain